MYCYNCGKELEQEARYCSICGTQKASVWPSSGETRPPRRFSRVREGKKIAGVCGGVARHFDLDVTLVRILWILVTIFPPIPGLIAYIVCWIAMPQDPLPYRPPHVHAASPTADA
jgi:phage shock protein C